MKKKILFVVCLLSMFFFACAKSQQPVADVDLEVKEVIPAPAETETVLSLQTAELEKLQKAFALLPEKTKAGITNGDPQEFLADLYRVLEADTENLLILADKQHFLSADYVPEDIVPLKPNDFYLLNRNDLSLREPVEKALWVMAQAAKEEGITLVASSTYRSYDYQKTVYERNVRQMGKEAADRESAAPGTSQHQLGTVVDFGSITDEFIETPAGQWLDKNASDYGWSLSFPQGYEDVTGYRWECWHYRYIGTEATAFQKKWFSNIQQFMMEFIHAWKSVE